jgi:hypothetical protein
MACRDQLTGALTACGLMWSQVGGRKPRLVSTARLRPERGLEATACPLLSTRVHLSTRPESNETLVILAV